LAQPSEEFSDVIERLKTLSSFLKVSFNGASLGSLNLNECVEALDRIIEIFPDLVDTIYAVSEDQVRLDWMQENLAELTGNGQRSCAGKPDKRYSPWNVTIKRFPEDAGPCGVRHFVHQGNLQPPELMNDLRHAIDKSMKRAMEIDAKE